VKSEDTVLISSNFSTALGGLGTNAKLFSPLFALIKFFVSKFVQFLPPPIKRWRNGALSSGGYAVRSSALFTFVLFRIVFIEFDDDIRVVKPLL
jgi:hypothetical protein